MNLSQATTRPFTKDAILSINSGQKGVYGIYRSNQWIYIGRGDIRDRMLAHVGGDNPDILRYQPTGWCAVVTADDVALEKAEILRCNPVCNKRLG